MGLTHIIARQIPGLRQAYVAYFNFLHRRKLRGKQAEDVFTEIYNENQWGSNDSVSGPGSAEDQTAVVVAELPLMLRDLSIETLLDVPCGDHNWMSKVDLGKIKYIGGDIVDRIIQSDIETYGSSLRTFLKLDLLAGDKLPDADLLFCRDCLVHFSYDHIFKAIETVLASDCEYLLTTSFVRHDNEDILTGQWRPLNLERTPFNFPPPIDMIDEKCTEGDGMYADKMLCLWRLSDLRDKFGKVTT